MPDNDNTLHTTHVPTTHLPAFDSRDPQLYFDLIEVIFLDESSRFLNAVYNLPFTVKQKAKHIFPSDVTDRFSKLKNITLNHFAVSQGDNLNTLLSQTTLGDRTAEDYLQFVRKLLPHEQKDSETIRFHFFRVLPDNIMPMAKFLPNEDLEKIAVAVDRALAHNTNRNTSTGNHTISTMHHPSTKTDVDRITALELRMEQRYIELRVQLEKQCQLLQEQIARIPKHMPPHRPHSMHPPDTNKPTRTRSLSRTRDQDQVKPSSQKPPNMCFYHSTYGASARKCMPPCSFPSGN